MVSLGSARASRTGDRAPAIAKFALLLHAFVSSSRKLSGEGAGKNMRGACAP